VVLIHINVPLTWIIFALLPLMTLYALYFNKRINVAMRRARDRIGDINAQIEDNLSGIRVVKSFANEEIERRKFARENDRFIDSKRAFYRAETYYYEGGGGLYPIRHRGGGGSGRGAHRQCVAGLGGPGDFLCSTSAT
jgi:ATP-binding cassette subfamily B protein